MNKYIHVDGHPGLVRDRNTGAIINLNEDEMRQARKRKNMWKQQQEELNSLREDVAAMKAMLSQLLEK